MVDFGGFFYLRKQNCKLKTGMTEREAKMACACMNFALKCHQKWTNVTYSKAGTDRGKLGNGERSGMANSAISFRRGKSN